jgi:hypothetical protein
VKEIVKAKVEIVKAEGAYASLEIVTAELKISSTCTPTDRCLWTIPCKFQPDGFSHTDSANEDSSTQWNTT